MTKREFVRTVREKTGLPLKDVEAVLSAAGETAIEALARGESVPLCGLGKLVPYRSAPRRWRLPDGRTGEVPSRTRVRFRASETLRKRLG